MSETKAPDTEQYVRLSDVLEVIRNEAAEVSRTSRNLRPVQLVAGMRALQSHSDRIYWPAREDQSALHCLADLAEEEEWANGVVYEFDSSVRLRPRFAVVTPYPDDDDAVEVSEHDTKEQAEAELARWLSHPQQGGGDGKG